MKFFYDCEFADTGNEARPTIDLISIGIVSEDGDELYLESSEFDINNCDDWVKANVLTRLGPVEERKSRKEIANLIIDFLGQKPELWGYYPSYDHVVFCWIFGKMINLPKGFPMFTMCLQQWWVMAGRPVGVKPPNTDEAHNALVDAHWNRQLYKNLKKYEFPKSEV